MKKRWAAVLFLSVMLALLLVSLPDPASAAMDCVWCGGDGEVRCNNCSGIDYTCSKCHGRGYVSCIYCKGTGKVGADTGIHNQDDPGSGTGSGGSGTDSHPSSIYCGDNLKWNLSSDGVLTISGTGSMYSYRIVAQPWDRSRIKKVVIQKGVTSIGNYAFQDCGSLTSVSIASSVTEIGEECFSGCKALQSVTLPRGVKKICTGAFHECSGLKSVTIPTSVTTMEGWVFAGCTSLQTVTIPNSVTRIESWTFYNSGLKYITIPDSVINIVNFAFENITENLTIYCNSGSYARKYAADKGIRVVLRDVKPAIVTQPRSASVNEGNPATFKVTATGATGYQWYYRKSSSDTWKASTSSSAKTNTYSFSGLAAYSGHQYRCLVKNSAGSVYTNTVTLTVITKPVITVQPASKTVKEGTTVQFTVTAKGATLYQWYYRNSSSDSWKASTSSSAKTNTYSFSGFAALSGHQYRCLVKNSAGSVYTNTVTLTVKPKPVITTQPASKTVKEGNTVKFIVTATGATGYQWYYRNSSSDSWKASTSTSAKTNTYSFSGKAAYSGNQYRCLVKNSAGSVYTNTVTLTVISKPVITAQPVSKTVKEGTTVQFTVTAKGTTSYQWYYRNSSSDSWKASTSSNGKTNTYSFSGKASYSGHQYRCLVKNSAGSVYTNTVTLTVKPMPVITAQPASKTVKEGTTVKFTVTATGATGYQWYYRNSSSDSWKASTSTSAKTNTYSFSGKASYSGHQYRCLVKNSAGSLYSNIVTLTVTPAGSCGKNVVWMLSSDGKLTISGSGPMYDYEEKGPWETKSVKSVVVASGVTAIGKNAFCSCRDVTSVSLPSTVTRIGEKAFFCCFDLTQLKIPSNVVSIGRAAFMGCLKLTSIAIPSGVEIICRSTFSDCSSLKEVTLPNTLTSIDGYAFDSCKALTAISIPKSVTSIHDDAFEDCSSDLTIQCYSGSAAHTFAQANGFKVKLLEARPAITTQPKSVTVNEGAKATFKVVASGAKGYQWYYRNSSSDTWKSMGSGYTAATMSFTTKASHTGHQYRCLVKNSAGSVYTNTVTLTVKPKPVITAQPSSVTVKNGATVTFRVTAAGATSYQWYYRKSSSDSWTAISTNGTESSYKLSGLTKYSGRQYRCLVKNSAGSVYSNIVTLTVK